METNVKTIITDQDRDNIIKRDISDIIHDSVSDPQSNERVNHPSHYTWLKNLCGIEVIDITRHMDFDLGNAIKYILRAGHKGEEGLTSKDKAIEDLEKAIFYLKDKICTLKKN